MAFTIEFLYEDEGELKPVRALDDEVLDDDKIRSIMNLKVFDTIPLGSGSEKGLTRSKRYTAKFRVMIGTLILLLRRFQMRNNIREVTPY